MKKFILLIVTLGCFSAYGQQITQFSQYMQNKFVINPAAAGLSGKLNVNLGYRNQWNGLQDAPQGYYVSGDYVLGSLHDRTSYIDKSIRVSNPDLFKTFDSTGHVKHVVGAYVMGNRFNPVNTTSGYAGYAFHYPIHEFYISAGASLGMNNLQLDFSSLTVDEQADQKFNDFMATNQSSTAFDLNVGVMIYSHNFFLGYSTNRILGNSLNFGKESLDVTLNTHHFLSTGVKIEATDKLTIKPSVLVRGVKGAPGSFDINAILDFKHFVWGGVSYRNQDAIVGIIGVLFNNHYNLSYSYDITTSGLNSYSNGSHEIMLGAKL